MPPRRLPLLTTLLGLWLAGLGAWLGVLEARAAWSLAVAEELARQWGPEEGATPQQAPPAARRSRPAPRRARSGAIPGAEP